jgi:predicted ATP-dependent serine protease
LNFDTHEHELTKEAAAVVQDFDSVMAAAGLSKLFLLSDHAGAGKSTTMRQLAVRIKEKLPDHWVTFSIPFNTASDAREERKTYLQSLLISHSTL